MNSKDRNNKSLCGNSMKMVANILKQSTFSIAKMSLGDSAAAKSHVPITEPAVLAVEPLLSQISRSRRSEKPQNSSKPASILMVSNKGNESSYVIHEDKSAIDGKASAYITKVHKKNLSDFSESSNLPQYILPPPPPAVI